MRLMKAEEALKQSYENPDLLVISGSRLYGTARTNEAGEIISDTDLRGFCVPPWEYLTTRTFNQQDLDGDHVIFSSGFFIAQLISCNPQFFEIFFAPDSHILKKSAIGERVLGLRDAVSSKRFYKRILGFSASEWRKARGVKSIIPERTLTEEQVIQDIRTVFGPIWGDSQKEIMDAILSLAFSCHKTTEVSSVDGISKKRRHEFEQFGFCCSSACHSIRLVEQCTELMETGKMTFPRPNAGYLRDVKLGKFTIEDVTPYYEDAVKKCEASIKTSSLQERPDAGYVKDVYEDIVAQSLLNDRRLQARKIDNSKVDALKTANSVLMGISKELGDKANRLLH